MVDEPVAVPPNRSSCNDRGTSDVESTHPAFNTGCSCSYPSPAKTAVDGLSGSLEQHPEAVPPLRRAMAPGVQLISEARTAGAGLEDGHILLYLEGDGR